MIKKYKTHLGSLMVNEVNVIRETDKYVYLNGWPGEVKARRVAKSSEFGGAYFDTWVEARNYLTADAIKNIEHAKSQLRIATERYNKILEMVEPKK